MKKATLILALFFGFIPMLNAQWVSPGNGTTYTFPDLLEVSNGVVGNNPSFPSNYGIGADLTISENDVLIIDDQVSHITAMGVLITIKGSLICENSARVEIGGSQTNPYSVRFENATGCNIKNMYFSLGGGIKVIESEVTFENVNFVYFTRDYCNSVIDILNCDPIINNCNFTINDGAAISSPANGQSSPQILNCQFSYNVISNANQPQINLGPGSQDTIRIVNCTLEGYFDMSGGITIADLMNTGETKILLKDNVIKNNRYGYNQQGYNLSSVIVGNQFIDNNLETNPMNGGSGISIYGVNENNRAIFRNNVITGNLWGITAINAFNIDLGTEDDWGHNQIHDNGNGGVIYDLYNNSACNIMAIGNYWGTTDEQEIEDHITHQNDNPSLGLVTYLPFLTDDGVVESNTTSFEVWPNPAQGRFTIEGKGKMTITNALGQIILTKDIDGKENIALPKGLYFVKLGGMTRKVVVE